MNWQKSCVTDKENIFMLFAFGDWGFKLWEFYSSADVHGYKEIL